MSGGEGIGPRRPRRRASRRGGRREDGGILGATLVSSQVKGKANRRYSWTYHTVKGVNLLN